MLPAAGLSREELEQAFSLFTQASEQLAASYQELQQQVERLTQELAVANGELLRQYQEKAALSERLSSLLEALPAGVVEVDAAGRVVEANPAAERLLGTSPTGERWSRLEDRLEPTNTPDEYVLGEAEAARRLQVATTLRPQSGRAIVVLHDITENHQIRRALERHQRLSQMGEMAARLAHQLRTPLATALLYAGNLARPHLADEDRQRFAGKAVDRLRHLESLIQQMLWFVKGQQAGVERVPVQDVLAEVVGIIEPQMERKGYVFSLANTLTEVQIRVERKTLIGVLINLLENAIQATLPGKQIALSACRGTDGVVIAVQDQGCGIPPENLERLFEPFFTTRSDGTG